MKRKKKWMRMLAATAFAVILALPFSAAADEVHTPVDLTEKCSLAVNVAMGGTDYAWDLELSQVNWGNVSLELYRLAGVEQAEGLDDYTYISSLQDGSEDPFSGVVSLANEYVRREPLSGAGAEEEQAGVTAAQWDALAQLAAQTVRGPEDGNPLTASYTGNVLEGITGIDAGLYLLLIRDPGSDFKEITLEDGSQSVATVVRSAHYEYEFSPALVSLPVHKEVQDGAGNHTGYRWSYGALISPKYGLSYRYGSLMLAKTLESYRAGEPATFIFRVESSYDDGRAGAGFRCNELVTLYYGADSLATQVETLDIRFPIGAQVTVTEIYSGSSYSLAAGSEPIQGETIGLSEQRVENGITVPADTQLVQFTNVYSASGNRGGSVENSFENTGSQWTWTQTTADANGLTTGQVVRQPAVAPTPGTSPTPEPSVSPTPEPSVSPSPAPGN